MEGVTCSGGMDDVDEAVMSQEQVEETEELLERGLREMREWLKDKTEMPGTAGVKSSWKLPPCAPVWTDPALDGELLMFLRCELFNAKAAAKRYTKYWRRRATLFGERATCDLTSREALLDSDVVALRKGYAVMLPGVRDPMGRVVVVVRPGRLDHKAYPRESMVRACWFVLHKILKEVQGQRRGVCILVVGHEGTYAEYDSQLERALLDSLQATLPLRIGAVDICNPPWFFSAIFAVLRLFMADKVYQRIRIHAETNAEKLILLLRKRGLERDMVPTELNGDYEVHWDKWCDRALAPRGAESGEEEAAEALLCAESKALSIEGELGAGGNGHGVHAVAAAPARGTDAEPKGEPS